MAVIVELRTESGEVLAAGGGDGALERLASAARESSPCLRWIDPYGDTVFNSTQSAALAAELREAAKELSGAARAAVERLIEMAQACADGVHVYLWCIGD